MMELFDPIIKNKINWKQIKKKSTMELFNLAAESVKRNKITQRRTKKKSTMELINPIIKNKIINWKQTGEIPN
jgi:hypothetical protein